MAPVTQPAVMPPRPTAVIATVCVTLRAGGTKPAGRDADVPGSAAETTGGAQNAPDHERRCGEDKHHVERAYDHRRHDRTREHALRQDSVGILQLAPAAERAEEQDDERSEERKRRHEATFRDESDPITTGPGIGGHPIVRQRSVPGGCEADVFDGPIPRPNAEDGVGSSHVERVPVLRDATAAAPLLVIDDAAR